MALEVLRSLLPSLFAYCEVWTGGKSLARLRGVRNCSVADFVIKGVKLLNLRIS